MDLFNKWLAKKENELINRALTDKSYKNVMIREGHLGTEDQPDDSIVNADLATLGDAIIRLSLLALFFDKKDSLSKEKEKYESDKYLVEVVANHYEILRYLKYDTLNRIESNYVYRDDASKFIATAVEAVVGAIYLSIKDKTPLVKLVQSWVDF